MLQASSRGKAESRSGGGNIEHIYTNGVSSQVIFGMPTATCVVGSLRRDDGLTSSSTSSISRTSSSTTRGRWAA